MQEELIQRQRDRDEVDGQKQGVDSGDKARHIDGNDQLFAGRMMLVAERR